MSSHNVFHASGRRFNYSGNIFDSGEASSSIGCDRPDRFLPILTSRIPLHADASSKTSGYGAKLLALLDSTYEQHPQASSDHTLLSRLYHAESLNIKKKTPVPSRYSAAQNACSAAEFDLDTGDFDDTPYPAHPCAWSCRGIIALCLCCELYIYDGASGVGYRILDMKHGSRSVEWLPDHTLAIGGITGSVLLFDPDTKLVKTTWMTSAAGLAPDDDDADDDLSIETLHFSKERGLLAAGRYDGSVACYDPRMRCQAWDIKMFKHGGVRSVKWSPDGLYLAVGGVLDSVKYMDCRTCKSVTLRRPPKRNTYLRKDYGTRLAWAPWEPRLLASTGVTDGDCQVHLWSISGSDGPNHGYKHLQSAIFSSKITSLHFSPHVTELLFTYGNVIKKKNNPVQAPRRRGSRTVPPPPPPEIQRGMAVYSYPSLQRVFSAKPHDGPIVDSVLSADGTRLLTYGTDVRMRAWTIWGERKKEKAPTMMNRMTIR